MSEYRNYEESLKSLRDRRNPDANINFSKEAVFNEERHNKVREGPSTRFLIGAMEAIDLTYTQTSYDQAARVENHITKALGLHGILVEFEYQGSVTKGTHIRGHSDIDLLTLEKRFFTVQSPQVVSYPYQGDPLDDLKQLRDISSARLDTSFPEATVDTSGAKSFKIYGGSLQRTVDIVPANWFNTNEYKETGSKVYRGIHIYDCHENTRIADQPFVHSHLLDLKDKQSSGGLRSLVRLCKTLSAEAPDKEMPSSYDIEALIYAMDVSDLKNLKGSEVRLAYRCKNWLAKVFASSQTRAILKLPDGKRGIFDEGYSTPTQVLNLFSEINGLLSSIENEWSTSGRTLAEGKILEPYSAGISF